MVFRRVAVRVVNGTKNVSKYNILQENDHAPPQVNCQICIKKLICLAEIKTYFLKK
jgi:hypothetical protein